MQAGRLRTLITIDRPVTDRDAAGQTALAWQRVGQVWGELEQISGREQRAAMQTVTEATWRAVMRWTPGLDVRRTDRLSATLAAGAVTLDVLDVRNVKQRNRMIEIEAKEHG